MILIYPLQKGGTLLHTFKKEHLVWKYYAIYLSVNNVMLLDT